MWDIITDPWASKVLIGYGTALLGENEWNHSFKFEGFMIGFEM